MKDLTILAAFAACAALSAIIAIRAATFDVRSVEVVLFRDVPHRCGVGGRGVIDVERDVRASRCWEET